MTDSVTIERDALAGRLFEAMLGAMAATSTVMRQETLRRNAEDAGFRAVETLPIAHDW